MTNNFDLVIFDCDGVLVDSEIISARMLQAELKSRDVDVTLDHIIQNHVGRSYPTVLAEIQSTFGVILDDDFGDKYRERLIGAFERDLKIIPHVEDVIAKLNVPKCVATSSSPKRVKSSLNIVGLTDYFEGAVFTASEVKNGKPAPDLFLHAAKNMGVKPENCLVIEDSIAGVTAGLAAGMNVLRFTGGSHINESSSGMQTGGAREIFNSFSDFFTLCPTLEM